jgi:hypothetical protein
MSAAENSSCLGMGGCIVLLESFVVSLQTRLFYRRSNVLFLFFSENNRDDCIRISKMYQNVEILAKEPKNYFKNYLLNI